MASRHATRYVIGVFTNWQALGLAVAALTELFEMQGRLTLLAAVDKCESDSDLQALSKAQPDLRDALSDRCHLAFAQRTDGTVMCTSGVLSNRLQGRIRDGSCSLGEALSMWMLPRLASDLADDVRQGRILLWVRLFATDPEQEISETLFSNGPLRIEVHDLVPSLKT